MAYTRTLKPIDASEKGCAKCYPLTYTGSIRFAHPEDQELVNTFVTNYNEACVNLLKLLKHVVENPRYEMVSAVLLMPSVVSPAIESTHIWKELKGDSETKPALFGDPGKPDKEVTSYSWDTLKKNAAYYLLQVLTDPADAGLAKSRPARVFRQILNEKGIEAPSDLVTKNKLEEIFAKLPFMDKRGDAANAVFANLRSHMSNRSNTIAANQKKEADRKEAIQNGAGFFNPFDVYCQDQRSWMRACSQYRELRKALIESYEPDFGKKTRGIFEDFRG